MLQVFNQVLGHILLLPTKVAMLNNKECIHQDKGVTLPLKGTLPLKDILPLRAILHLRAILLLRATLRLEAIHRQSLSNLCQVVNHRLMKVSLIHRLLDISNIQVKPENGNSGVYFDNIRKEDWTVLILPANHVGLLQDRWDYEVLGMRLSKVHDGCFQGKEKNIYFFLKTNFYGNFLNY